MLCHSPSSLDDKKVSSKDTKHFTIALSGKTVDSAEGALCFESYGVSVIDLLGAYSFLLFSLKASKMKR
jgi:hypothetical protein